MIGFVRSFGKYLPEEGITLNAVCPNVVRTSKSLQTHLAPVLPRSPFHDTDVPCAEDISTGAFYDKLESKPNNEKVRLGMCVIRGNSVVMMEALDRIGGGGGGGDGGYRGRE